MKKFIQVVTLIFITSILSFAQKPYVLLVSFDGFRWDYLDRGITPNLKNFYEEGIRAKTLRPVFPSKTFPNHISIITGMYPEHHGIITNKFENIFTHKFYKLSDRAEVRNSEWYWGEPFWVTAKLNGIRTASFYWPSSTVRDSNVAPDIYKIYDGSVPYKSRVDSVVKWFRLPENIRPHFITLYFSETDTYGHKYGPNSKEILKAIKDLDDVSGYLFSSLKKAGIYDSVNVIIVSDHGMTEINKNRIINIQKFIPDFKVKYSNSGPMMMIEPKKNDLEKVYNILKSHENHFKVFKKRDVPEYLHFSSNPFIYSIVLVADLGWSLTDDSSIKMYVDDEHDNKGNHGYDNHLLDMHGIFIARGPAFKKGYVTGTLRNIDIYPLLCKIFNLRIKSNIDGNIKRIEHILKW